MVAKVHTVEVDWATTHGCLKDLGLPCMAVIRAVANGGGEIHTMHALDKADTLHLLLLVKDEGEPGIWPWLPC